jgi:hypothetical protein
MPNQFVHESKLPPPPTTRFDAVYLVGHTAYTPVRLHPRRGATRPVFDGRAHNLIVEVADPNDAATRARVLRALGLDRDAPLPAVRARLEG